MNCLIDLIRMTGLLLCVVSWVTSSGQTQRRAEVSSLEQTSQTSQTGTGAGSAAAKAAEPGEADGTGNPALGGRRPLYRLNRSDIVALSFTLSPEFDQSLTIQPDGYIMLKDAGALFAQGLTLEELRQAVLKAYTGYLHDPQVAIALKEFEHPYFIAGGEVGRPGKYELRADLNVIQAIEIAGGFTHQAKHSQVVLFRRVNDDRFEAHVFDLKRKTCERSAGCSPEI
jgi:polysaccharide biosynthesis/export protein